jgi:hypothetical protein
MKILISILLASLAVVSTVSAAPSPTSISGPSGVPAFDQCFQWIWLADFYAGKEDMFQALRNQAECRADRLAKFGI